MTELAPITLGGAKSHFHFKSPENAARWDRISDAMEDIPTSASGHAGPDHNCHPPGPSNMAEPMAIPSSLGGSSALCHGRAVPSHAYRWNKTISSNDSGNTPPTGFAGVARLSHAEIRTLPRFEEVTDPNHSWILTPPGFRRRLPECEAIRSPVRYESAARPRPSKSPKMSRPSTEPETAFARSFAQPVLEPNGTSPSCEDVYALLGLDTERRERSRESGAARGGLFPASIPTSALLGTGTTPATSNPRHANRLHDTGAAPKNESRRLAMDSDESRVPWKTGIRGYRGRKPLVWARTIERLEAEAARMSERERENPALEDRLTLCENIWGSELTRDWESRVTAKPCRYAPPPWYVRRDG